MEGAFRTLPVCISITYAELVYYSVVKQQACCLVVLACPEPKRMGPQSPKKQRDLRYAFTSSLPLVIILQRYSSLFMTAHYIICNFSSDCLRGPVRKRLIHSVYRLTVDRFFLRIDHPCCRRLSVLLFHPFTRSMIGILSTRFLPTLVVLSRENRIEQILQNDEHHRPPP